MAESAPRPHLPPSLICTRGWTVYGPSIMPQVGQGLGVKILLEDYNAAKACVMGPSVATVSFCKSPPVHLVLIVSFSLPRCHFVLLSEPFFRRQSALTAGTIQQVGCNLMADCLSNACQMSDICAHQSKGKAWERAVSIHKSYEQI
ncbi:unnamed protein product [Ostreobium quekettii]|uniref:Uncharacterized protein n=1 Tax=Ostreobium quekettii TaxID=121088 RepID=A0A8S1JEE4_9CHLO|nr:unnamed protein product [Ostreobium quekettii]